MQNMMLEGKEASSLMSRNSEWCSASRTFELSCLGVLEWESAGCFLIKKCGTYFFIKDRASL